MRKLLVLAAMTLLFPAVASAQVSVGARIGLALPMGDQSSGAAMSDVISVALPLQVDLMLQAAPQLGIGAYLGYAFAASASNQKDFCDFYGFTCSNRVLRFGVKGEYALNEAVVGGGFAPYLGASLGYEKGSTKLEAAGDWMKTWASGWELGLEAGANMKSSETMTLGAFVNLSFGKYGKSGTDCSNNAISIFCGLDGDITDTAMHEWLTVGVRGAFGL
jgi:hypothetical protein